MRQNWVDLSSIALNKRQQKLMILLLQPNVLDIDLHKPHKFLSDITKSNFGQLFPHVIDKYTGCPPKNKPTL